MASFKARAMVTISRLPLAVTGARELPAATAVA
jgi:hypothetical protein